MRACSFFLSAPGGTEKVKEAIAGLFPVREHSKNECISWLSLLQAEYSELMAERLPHFLHPVLPLLRLGWSRTTELAIKGKV